MLIDAGDRGARDVIACHGGNDVTQGDETDALEGCTPPAIDDIARVKFFWEVRFGPRLSVPTTLRVRYTPFYGEMQSPFARCSGAACHGARLEYTRRAAATCGSSAAADGCASRAVGGAASPPGRRCVWASSSGSAA